MNNRNPFRAPMLLGVLILLMLASTVFGTGCALSGGAGIPGVSFQAGVGVNPSSGQPAFNGGVQLDLVTLGCYLAHVTRADSWDPIAGFCPESADSAAIDLPAELDPFATDPNMPTMDGPEYPATLRESRLESTIDHRLGSDHPQPLDRSSYAILERLHPRGVQSLVYRPRV